MNRKGKIIILSGPSGSGKTTLQERILKDHAFKGRLVKSVSATTRQPRPGEQDGKDYFFVSERMFRHKKDAGHFLESEKVFQSFYGTPHRAVQDILKTGRSVLLCIDVKGARTVARKGRGQVVRIFVRPPSLRVLEQRLRARRTEGLGDLKVRLATAEKEMEAGKKYDYTVTNDDLDRAYRELKTFLFRVIKGD